MIHEVIVMTLLDTKIARPALQTANVLEDPFQPSVTRSGPVMEVFDDDVMLYIFFQVQHDTVAQKLSAFLTKTMSENTL